MWKTSKMTLRSVWLIASLLCCLPGLALADSAELVLSDAVLHEDTVWRGAITVDGVVVVGRGAILTIEPGTTVRFRYRDRNHDGIGDSELRVLGGIRAQGTAARPIVFTSAEPNPSPKDWSYLLIFTSGKKNQLAYCQFSYAFSGLQVHFSTAEVHDCLFRENQEGLRFGRAKMSLHHCLITQNTIGVRFTRMEGPVEIQHNEINNNQTGIFLVPSGQNIVDFFEPGRTGKPWNEGHLDISANNIRSNREYNLKLGAKQRWDLQVGRNWWGSSISTTVASTIFDQQRDAELGRALIEPLALKSITDAGIRETTQSP